jgi:hypothetical protein
MVDTGLLLLNYLIFPVLSFSSDIVYTLVGISKGYKLFNPPGMNYRTLQ